MQQYGCVLTVCTKCSSSGGRRVTLPFTAMHPPLCCACCSCAAVLAIGGVGGLAVGLAGREILENLFTGLIILSSNPFEVRQCLSVCFVVVAVVLRPCLPACLSGCVLAGSVLHCSLPPRPCLPRLLLPPALPARPQLLLAIAAPCLPACLPARPPAGGR